MEFQFQQSFPKGPELVDKTSTFGVASLETL
jgi:hypothetical protein